MRILFNIIFFTISCPVLAQLTADFNIPSEVCLEEQVEFGNTSINADSYEWDFCADDFSESPDVVSGYASLLSSINSFKIIQAEEQYYGFGVGTDDNLYRFEFGASLENIPNIVNLGDFGLLNSAEGIDIHKDSSGDWVGFIGHYINGGGGYVVRLVWNDLGLPPVAENIGNLDVLSRIRDMKIVRQGSDYIGVFIYFNESTLIRVNFGNSLKNSFTLADITESSPLSNVDRPVTISTEKLNGEWRIIVGSVLSKTISIFNLGTDIVSEPVEVKSQAFSGYANLEKLTTIRNQDQFFVHLSTTGGVYIINLKGMASGDTFEELALSGIPNSSGVEMIFDSGRYVLFGASTSLNRYVFESECKEGDLYSTEINPQAIYSQSGTYPITLTAFHSNGNSASITNEISVSTNQAPEGNFNLDSAYCIADNINFTFNTPDDISTYNWDFGDGNMSTDISPSHQYVSEGQYIVTLELESSIGCPNIFYDTLNILPEPQPDFSTSDTEFCTFEAIDFTNTTSFDFGEKVNWYWDFNGEGNSTEENPSFTFESSGNKTIILQANVLGCVQTYQSTLEIIDGPQPDFEYDRNCLGEAVQFNNLSTGANITGYQWDFGNGESSEEEDPEIIYNNAGNYTVELTVSNASGCETSTTQNIQIYDQITDSIVVGEAIENLPFELIIDWRNDFDSTQNSSYQWDINGEIQTSDTASYILAQGVYMVDLEITTSSSCIFTAERTIEVKASEYPTPNFSIPPELCLEEQFELGNTSINATAYEWDYCADDFSQVPDISSEFENLPSSVNSFKVVNEDGNYYGFGVGSDDNLYRFDFGNSLENVPDITNLGDFGLLNSAEGIDIHKDSSGDWVGFVGHFVNGGGGYVVRLVWDDLATQPTAENIGNLEVLSRIRDLKIVRQGSDYIGVFLYFNESTLIRVNFGGSLKSSFTSSDITSSSALPNVDRPLALSIENVNGEWRVIIGSVVTKTISIFDLGTDILSEPIEVKNQVFSGFGNFEKLNTIPNQDEYYLHLSTTTGVHLINLMGMGSDDNFEEISLTDIPNSSGVEMLYDSGRYVLFGASNLLNRYIFESRCTEGVLYSEATSFQTSYSQPGTYPITLTAYHPNGNSASITKEITVSNNQAPDITFNTGANLCVTNPIQFESQSTSGLSSYRWEFGDGNASSEANPEHLYSSAGDYIVQLSVTDTAGCNNLFQDSITIYAEPEPDFQVTAQGSLCSQKPVIFENLTNLPTEAVFLWEFGDGTSSTDESPEHIYEEAGEYIINFQIEMAGCLVEKTYTITVNPGPLVDFNYSDDCYGQVLNFENISTGDFLQNFQWSFGDGTQSTQTNPKHRYDSAGTYDVQLSAFTSNGCDYTFQQQVIVHPVATVAFEAGVACAEQPVQFTEQVALQQSNITDYLWDFGISGTTSDRSTEANPQFVFPTAGTFEVQLQVTTADGCTSTASQVVAVQALPQPSFTYEKNCLFNPIIFSPENTENISSHFWELQNPAGEVIFSAQSENFSYIFETPGSYQLRYRQENEDLCSNTITETLEILPLPEPDFEVGNVCTNQNIFFENLTDLKGNNLEKYNWTIDGEVISTDFRPQYTFQNSGDFLLGLQVETESGCIQSISKTISVSESPTAVFELEQNLGAFPYVLSTSAEDYPLEGIIGVFTGVSWTLNGDTISNSQELNYTIEQEGTYLLGLIVTNEAGCTASHYEQIRIRKPNLDVALSNLRITQDQEFTSFVLNISNRGTLVPESLNLDIDLGSYSITETIEEPLLPEKSRNVALSIKLTEEQLRGLAKICIQAIPQNLAAAETNVSNNRVCTNLESGLKVMEIYPNPAVTEFTLPMIIPENASVNLSLEQSNGQNVKTLSYDLEAGYNEIQISRDNLKPGIYFLRIRYQGEEIVKKIIFQ